MKGLTRRNFILGSGITAAGIASASMLSACSPNSTNSENEKVEKNVLKNASQTREVDVVIAGLGAAGLLAAYGAAKAGCSVIAIDATASMAGTTNTRTSAAFAVGSSLQDPSPEPLTIEEFMSYVNTGTNYQSNNKALRAIIEASGRAVDVFVSAGMPFNVDFTNSTSADPMMVRGGCVYGVAGEERAEYFSKIADDAGVECLFNTVAENLIIEDGNVRGLQCTSGKDILDIRSKAVILATGGFLGSAEETAKHFAGAKIVCMGNELNTGNGINMAISAGAQLGKCFSISMNEYGGANTKASPTYSFRPTSGTNEAMRLPVFGGILLDSEGERFVNEGVMCEKTMFCCEPLVRESYYYAVCDEAFMKRWETESLSKFLGDERMKGMFSDVMATDIRKQFDKAIDEGWAYKANSLSDLANYFNLTNLEQTVEQYNEYCEAGTDELFFKNI